MVTESDFVAPPFMPLSIIYLCVFITNSTPLPPATSSPCFSLCTLSRALSLSLVTYLINAVFSLSSSLNILKPTTPNPISQTTFLMFLIFLNPYDVHLPFPIPPPLHLRHHSNVNRLSKVHTERNPHQSLTAQMLCALRRWLWLVLDGWRQWICQATPSIERQTSKIWTVCQWWSWRRITQSNDRKCPINHIDTDDIQFTSSSSPRRSRNYLLENGSQSSNAAPTEWRQ